MKASNWREFEDILGLYTMHVREYRRFMLNFMRPCVLKCVRTRFIMQCMGRSQALVNTLLLRFSFRSNTIQPQLDEVKAETLTNKASKGVFTVKQSCD